MTQATIQLQGLYGPAGNTIRFLVSEGGDPDSVSRLLLQAALGAPTPADLPRSMLDLGSTELLAGIRSCQEYAETAEFHYQLWTPLEGCSLMILVRGVRADKGRREWFVRSGPMSLETFLLSYQEVAPNALPLWGVKTTLLTRAA